MSGRRVEELAAAEAPPEPARGAQGQAGRGRRAAGRRKAAAAAHFRPQLATPAARPPEGDDWLHEIKFDGYRTIARIEGGAVRLITRAGLDWTDRYGDLAEAFRGLPCKQALIDGEIVVQDERGIASFARCRTRSPRGARRR